MKWKAQISCGFLAYMKPQTKKQEKRILGIVVSIVHFILTVMVSEIH